jgi:hypothetical protein
MGGCVARMPAIRIQAKRISASCMCAIGASRSVVRPVQLSLADVVGLEASCLDAECLDAECLDAAC